MKDTPFLYTTSTNEEKKKDKRVHVIKSYNWAVIIIICVPLTNFPFFPASDISQLISPEEKAKKGKEFEYIDRDLGRDVAH